MCKETTNETFVMSDKNIRELLKLSDDEIKLLKEQINSLEENFWNTLLGYTLRLRSDTVGKVISVFHKRFGSFSDYQTIQCVAYLLKRFQFVFPQSQNW